MSHSKRPNRDANPAPPLYATPTGAHHFHSRMREGVTPVLNAVSLFLMLASADLALMLLGKPASRKAN